MGLQSPLKIPDILLLKSINAFVRYAQKCYLLEFNKNRRYENSIFLQNSIFNIGQSQHALYKFYRFYDKKTFWVSPRYFVRVTLSLRMSFH